MLLPLVHTLDSPLVSALAVIDYTRCRQERAEEHQRSEVGLPSSCYLIDLWSDPPKTNAEHDEVAQVLKATTLPEELGCHN